MVYLFIKDGAEMLSKPISDLISLSISLASVPESCKVAKLKPLFKKGSKLEPKNFRPPVISKVLEKVIHDQMQTFLTDNNILYCYQSGFRKFHSTDTCLSYLNYKILKSIDCGLMTGLILIDLRKAFDTIDHEILLEKMVHLQFSTQSIMWFKSYLTNRTFIVNVENSFSEFFPKAPFGASTVPFVPMACLVLSTVKCYCTLMIPA